MIKTKLKTKDVKYQFIIYENVISTMEVKSYHQLIFVVLSRISERCVSSRFCVSRKRKNYIYIYLKDDNENVETFQIYQ